MSKRWVILVSALLVAGCGSETASFVPSDAVSLTLERTKPYFWSSGWQVEMVVRTDPLCQRRHSLKEVGEGAFKVELYGAAPGIYILHQGKRWYVTSLKTCDLQQFQEPPEAPGTLLGAFDDGSGRLAFALDKSAAGTAPAAPAQ